MINNFVIKTIGYNFNVTITASAKYLKRPLIIKGLFLLAVVLPQISPHIKILIESVAIGLNWNHLDGCLKLYVVYRTEKLKY